MAEETGPSTPNADAGGSKGEPSDQLKRLFATAGKGGILETDTGDDYTFVTDAKPEAGIFRIVGGYLDPDGNLHDEVELRGMSGDEEDLLADDRSPFMLRMNGIMARVLRRIGSITDQSLFYRIVNSLPSGSRTDLMIYMRLVTHWKSTGDVYDMRMRCPDRTQCGQESNHKINLLQLDRYQPASVTSRDHDIELEDAGCKAAWRWMDGDFDHVLDVVAEDADYRKDYLTLAIAVRLFELNGENVELGVFDFLTRNKKRLKLSKKARSMIKVLKAMSAHDRGTLRADFLEKEPGVDTDLVFTCPHCGLNFEGMLRVGQSSFFFPQETRKRLNRRRSI